MLTEKETNDAYDQLIEILRETGFDWVAAQVDEQIRFGLEEKKRVSLKGGTLDESGDLVPGKRISRVIFAATREFTARERFAVLLNAAESAAVDAPLMAHDVAALLRAAGLPSSGTLVRLGLEEQRSAIDDTAAGLAAEQANRLRRLIDQIRKEM